MQFVIAKALADHPLFARDTDFAPLAARNSHELETPEYIDLYLECRVYEHAVPASGQKTVSLPVGGKRITLIVKDNDAIPATIDDLILALKFRWRYIEITDRGLFNPSTFPLPLYAQTINISLYAGEKTVDLTNKYADMIQINVNRDVHLVTTKPKSIRIIGWPRLILGVTGPFTLSRSFDSLSFAADYPAVPLDRYLDLEELRLVCSGMHPPAIIAFGLTDWSLLLRMPKRLIIERDNPAVEIRCLVPHITVNRV